MWDIHEGDIDFLNAVKLVPLEDLEFRIPKCQSSEKALNASSLTFLSVERCLKSVGRRL